MTVASITARSSTIDPLHIGPAHHRRRNTWMAIAALTMAFAIAASYAYWRSHDTGEAARLERFQRLYTERCDPAAFTVPASALARKLYLRSSTLQRALDSQLAALEAGAACDTVHRALRAVDFPLPSSVTPPARSATIDVSSH